MATVKNVRCSSFSGTNFVSAFRIPPGRRRCSGFLCQLQLGRLNVLYGSQDSNVIIMRDMVNQTVFNVIQDDDCRVNLPSSKAKWQVRQFSAPGTFQRIVEPLCQSLGCLGVITLTQESTTPHDFRFRCSVFDQPFMLGPSARARAMTLTYVIVGPSQSVIHVCQSI